MSGPTNGEIIEKTFDSAKFLTGGELNPTQQDQFVAYVKKFSRLLGMVRFVNMPNPKYDIDKMHISEPVTQAVAEGNCTVSWSSGQFNQVQLSAEKVRSAWNITTEALQSNIERSGFEDHLMETMTERIATDLELLAIQGDTTVTGTDPTALLLVRLDGWDIQTDGAHIIDAGGDEVSKNLFAAMLRAMPKQFKQDPGLRWLVSDTLANDWMNLLAERGYSVGDQALQGNGISPFGKPMIMVPLIPDDKALSILAATPASAPANRFGPFNIVTGSNDVLKLDIDNAGMRTVTFTQGVLETVEIARQINAVFAANSDPAVASDNGEGQLIITTTTTGAAAEIEIDDLAGGSTALVTLGYADGVVVTGSDAGTAGDVYEGTFLLLTNPMNLIFGMLAGTRVFSEFNKNCDRIETVVYNQVDAKIENIDAVVKGVNVRRQAL
jgi:hypothetical protein